MKAADWAYVSIKTGPNTPMPPASFEVTTAVEYTRLIRIASAARWVARNLPWVAIRAIRDRGEPMVLRDGLEFVLAETTVGVGLVFLGFRLSKPVEQVLFAGRSQFIS
jgi:hypothetical protein